MAHAHHSNKGHTHGKPFSKYPAQPLAEPNWTQAHPSSLEFDFVVAERAKYIPNSGPPLLPIGILPIHDKDGIIEDVISVDGNARYIVSYELKPALRMSIRAENVRDYVSARTLEDWEWKHTQIRNKLEWERLNPKAKSKAARMIKGREAPGNPTGRRKSGQPSKGRVLGSGPTKARKSSITSMGPGAGMGLGMLSSSSPNHTRTRELAYISPRRPNTSSPSKQRGLAEAIYSENESEDELDTSAALDRQLNGTPRYSQLKSKLPKQNFTSAISSGRLSNSINRDGLTFKRSRRLSSRDSSGSMDTGRSAEFAAHDDKRRKTFDRDGYVATVSSREASDVFEKLEQNRKLEKMKSKAVPYNNPLPPRSTSSKGSHPQPRKFVRMTKAQANKAKFDAKLGNRNLISGKNKTAPAVPSRLRESRSPSGDVLVPRQSEQTASSQDNTPYLRRSQRPSSRDQDDVPARRRSERSSSRASFSYAIPPPFKPEDLEPDREDSEPEYDIEAIVGEKWRTISGEKVLFYLIRWQEDYHNTWEPASNVGMGAVNEWEKEKRRLERPRAIKANVKLKNRRGESEKNPVPVDQATFDEIMNLIPDSDDETDNF